ncbi:putative poly polymerase [Diaporthe ampelina]|uniref:Putative poly polymerase n=1 Tax=Diaporthe ampelina TaxID=1214573 RepID=A0A0G2FHC8_9PEZI|nr:putative poly polymerase [Diaporthe ampelina]
MGVPHQPISCFFYGTLTQTKTLSRILDLKEEPVLRPAKKTGYAPTNWGQYRALVDGEPGQEVTSHACVVQSTEDELKPARDETNAYEAVPCWIRFTDGRDPAQEHGMMFKYAGGDEALKAGGKRSQATGKML